MSTQVVEAGGQKVLINSQTGETIRNLGPTAAVTKAQETAATAEADAQLKREIEIDTLQTKVNLINDIETHPGLNSRVGPSALGLPTRRGFAIADAFGAGDEFAGFVKQLTNQAFIDKLISAKAQGATFGALNQSEADSLREAATAINAWEVKDENGIGTGEWEVSETAFKRELDKIKEAVNKSIIRAGGEVEVDIDEAGLSEFIT